jgi:hypothetical protein
MSGSPDRSTGAAHRRADDRRHGLLEKAKGAQGNPGGRGAPIVPSSRVEAERQCCEIRLRAERKAGEVLRQIDRGAGISTTSSSSLCAKSAAMSGSPDRSTGVPRARVRARALLDGKCRR